MRYLTCCYQIEFSFAPIRKVRPKMEEIFFSIIIPVYKVELYLEECVESITQQSFKNFEIILVDDGSPDSCPELCDRFAHLDSRIQVIHKSNKGLSSARNSGMDLARGKYIVFLDSDDYYSRDDALMLMSNELEKSDADVLIIKSQKYYTDKKKMTKCNDESSTSDIWGNSYSNQLKYCVSRQLYDTCAWNKVFKRKLLEDTDLHFTEGIIAEDIDWAARLCLVAKSIAILKYPVHVYRKNRENSITSSLSMKNLIDTYGSIERCINYTKSINMDNIKKEVYFSYVSYRYIIWMAEASSIKSKEKKHLIQQMHEYDWLLDHDLNSKVRMVKKIYNILGYKITAYLLSIYLSVRDG